MDKLLNTSKYGSILVGIAVYKLNEQELIKTIESLKLSSIPLSLCLLCNSNDKDEHTKIEKLSIEFSVFSLINQPNKGFGYAHNKIVNSFNFDWYVCCNPDIIVKNNSIENIILDLIEDQNRLIAMPKVLNEDGSIQPLLRKFPTPINWFLRQLWMKFPNFLEKIHLYKKYNYNVSQDTEAITGCFFLIKRDTFVKINGFDEKMFLYVEDHELSYRTYLLGKNRYVSDAVVVHAWGQEYRRNFKTALLFIKNLIYFANKHKLW